MYGHSQLVDEFVVVGDDCRYEAAKQEEAGGGEGGGGRGRSARPQHGQSHGDGFFGGNHCASNLFLFLFYPFPRGRRGGEDKVWSLDGC